jgi:RNA polymerase sigma-70 factor (ECF subfamily)
VLEALLETPQPPPTVASTAPAPTDLEEARWVRALAGGDARAFESLYRRHAAGVHGFALRLTGRRSEAEDLTQEVFVRAWESRGRFQGPEHLANWLRRVTVNEWINRLRRHDPEPFAVREEDGAEIEPAGPPTAAPGTRLDLERAIAGLPPRLRAVLLLFDLYGCSHEEIGDQLGITRGASKVQLHRARRKLQEMLR